MASSSSSNEVGKMIRLRTLDGEEFEVEAAVVLSRLMDIRVQGGRRGRAREARWRSGVDVVDGGGGLGYGFSCVMERREDE